MRVSYFFVVPVAITCVGVTWWLGSKDRDFTTAPASAVIELESVKNSVTQNKSTLEVSDQASPAILVKPRNMPQFDETLEVEEKATVEEYVELGDLINLPGVSAYSSLAAKGPAYLIQLATILESRGEIQRSLLAWERVLDSTEPDADQRKQANQALLRLKPQLPLWMIDPTERTTLVLHAGCDVLSSKILQPIMEDIAKKLNECSSGIINFQFKIHPSRTTSEHSQPAEHSRPVALWVCADHSDAMISKTITIPSHRDDLSVFSSHLLAGQYKILRDEMIDSQGTIPPAKIEASLVDISLLFRDSVTRWHWSILAKRFSLKP